MLTRRIDGAVIRLAILFCFALAIVPRATLYEHEHAADTHGHVHAWDGARLDSVRELIDEARSGHDHDHTHAHPNEHEFDHEHASEHAPQGRAVAGEHDRRGPAYAEGTGPATRHAHTQAPFQSAARSLVTPLPLDRPQTANVAAIVVRCPARAGLALRARLPPVSARA